MYPLHELVLLEELIGFVFQIVLVVSQNVMDFLQRAVKGGRLVGRRSQDLLNDRIPEQVALSDSHDHVVRLVAQSDEDEHEHEMAETLDEVEHLLPPPILPLDLLPQLEDELGFVRGSLLVLHQIMLGFYFIDSLGHCNLQVLVIVEEVSIGHLPLHDDVEDLRNVCALRGAHRE